MSAHNCSEEDAETIAEQFSTLHTRGGPINNDPVASAPGRDETEKPWRTETNPHSVHFQEALYELEEQEVLEKHVAAAFRDDEYKTHFVKPMQDDWETVDCSNIFLANVPSSADNFGFCVDIGAPRSVIGKPQLNFFLRDLNKTSISKLNSSKSFRFGDVTVNSLGTVEIALDKPANISPIHVLMDIVPVHIPALLGLGVLDGECLYADNVTNRLVHRHVLSRTGEQLQYEDLWSVPLTRHQGHLYARMDFPHCMFYTTAQLKKLHRQFADPSADKLYNLLKIAGLEAVDSSTLEEIEKIVAACEPCQRINNAPL